MNLSSIFTDMTNWIGVGVAAANKGAAAATSAGPVLNTVVGSLESLTGIAKDLLKKPDPTPEHIAEVDRLRGELVAQANALK